VIEGGWWLAGGGLADTDYGELNVNFSCLKGLVKFTWIIPGKRSRTLSFPGSSSNHVHTAQSGSLFPPSTKQKTGQCREPLGNLGKNPIDAIASVRITASQPRFAGDTSPKTCSSRRWLEPLPLSRSTRSSTIGYRAQTSLPIFRLAHNLWGWSRAELQVWSELQPPPASRLAGKSKINGWIELPASLWSATFVAQESPDGSSILSFQSAQPEHPFLTMHLFVETELSGSSEGRDRTCRRSKGPANYHMGGCKTGFRSFRSSRGDPETHNTCCCVLP